MAKKNIPMIIITTLIAILWLVPLVWLLTTTFTKASFSMPLIPNQAFTLDNIKYVWSNVPFAQYYQNTILIVVVTFSVQFFTVTLAS